MISIVDSSRTNSSRRLLDTFSSPSVVCIDDADPRCGCSKL